MAIARKSGFGRPDTLCFCRTLAETGSDELYRLILCGNSETMLNDHE